ncbi:MAG: undecaprenyl/decaprenyl-phosphate alpha-N-acetylglucosaminyl 1-phosphate transferase [Planctomycetaceae bacterium]|jgi:UDP-GlcNAc:undecaprenyl-phosphate GlcNAc-1-phosphate transferase|nr:undecaprenyl/decaprenyl-phosphate alpha-N-acetylglucosaminyl 1-phosphate transferase [Planctomycetaceae bacterium]
MTSISPSLGLVLGSVVIVALVVSLWIVSWVKRHALRLGLIDMPNERKVHTSPIPRGGGLGIWLGVLSVFTLGTLALALASYSPTMVPESIPENVRQMVPGLWSKLSSIWLLLAGGSVVAILGLMDDRYGLDWRVRIAVEFAVAAVIVYGLKLQLTAYIDLPWLTPILSVIWIVMLINSFNMLDNMDALSAGVAAIIAGMLALMLLTTTEPAQREPQLFVGVMALALLGGLLGFLKHNWPPASIFMGDSGSYFVGYWIAVTTLLSTYSGSSGQAPHAVFAPLCLLAIPIYDTLSVIAIRLREGRSPFQADKKHFSHRLVELGMTKRQAVGTIYLATLTCSLGALLLPRTDWIGAGLVLLIVLAMLGLIALLESLTSKKSSS